MKKIVALCGCIAVVLLLGFADGTMQKKKVAVGGRQMQEGKIASDSDNNGSVRPAAAAPDTSDSKKSAEVSSN